MIARELMQQALDAFESGRAADRAEAMTALRERLAQPEQEPFEYWNAVEGWVKINEVRKHFDSVGCGTIYKTAGEDRVPLYTAPQQRKPLTEQDARLIAAAPDLLAALQGLLRGIANGPDEANAAMLIAKARDAVDKAMGEK
jgi:hypothetical protein